MGSNLASNRRGDTVTFTSYEGNRENILNSVEFDLTFMSCSTNPDRYLPDDLELLEVSILPGEYANLQCALDDDDEFHSAGIRGTDGYIIEMDSSSRMEPQYDGMHPVDYLGGGCPIHLCDCENGIGAFSNDCPIDGQL